MMKAEGMVISAPTPIQEPAGHTSHVRVAPTAALGAPGQHPLPASALGAPGQRNVTALRQPSNFTQTLGALMHQPQPAALNNNSDGVSSPIREVPESPMSIPDVSLHGVAEDIIGINQNVLSFSSISRPLDSCVDARVKEKIQADQYIEFGALINTNKSENFNITVQANTLSLVPKNKAMPIKTLDQWQSAFQIFVTVLTQAKPTMAAALMKYAHTIQTIAKRAGDAAAIGYDMMFRKWRQANPDSLPWDQVVSELYLEAMTSTNNNKRANISNQSSSQSQGKICYAFRNKGFCNKTNCSFQHTCKICKGPHSFRKCTKSNSGASQSSTASTGGNKSKPTSNK
ncbi:uncharacterized protein LOC117340318 [Pecten maximus]|uniref:uncharacterized protein LOC117340318 n=1 Tax=Pecten maximus TaxID=6579 RepID=UPI001458D37B|nr:uncharacterized protein LOC117340318 [Pecten maximus]